jgi:hypothetical protein
VDAVRDPAGALNAPKRPSRHAPANLLLLKKIAASPASHGGGGLFLRCETTGDPESRSGNPKNQLDLQGFFDLMGLHGLPQPLCAVHKNIIQMK